MISERHGARILIADDEPAIRRAVQTNLTRHGFQIGTAETGREALERAVSFRPDLVLLDLGLPDIDGLEVIRALRERGSTPIVVLSVRGQERDKVAALDLGADDYLTKPFGVDELLARVRVGLRHLARPAAGVAAVFRTGQLNVDLEHRRVTSAGLEVSLTPTEYELLKAFIAHPDKVLTDRMLLQRVWGPEYRNELDYLRVFIRRLRRKIEVDPSEPQYILTEARVGYRFRNWNQAAS